MQLDRMASISGGPTNDADAISPEHVLPMHLISKTGEQGAVFGSMGSSMSLSKTLSSSPELFIHARSPAENRSYRPSMAVSRQMSMKSLGGKSFQSVTFEDDPNSNNNNNNNNNGERTYPTNSIPDACLAEQLLTRIAFEHSWTPEELEHDLHVLNSHRIRTAKDIRRISREVWHEIPELLPVTKDLLRQAVGWKEALAQ
jgi:hypothetical protein